MTFSFHFPWWREEGRIPQKNHVMDTMDVMSLCVSLLLVYLVCKLISLAYYKELITAARVYAACSLLFLKTLTSGGAFIQFNFLIQ